MSLSALVAAWFFTLGGRAVGIGAFTSLALTGPLLDVALRRASSGWRLYLAFAIAGLASNLLALAARLGGKLAGIEQAKARPIAAWLPQAIPTYVVCGLIAGLICAILWFRLAAEDSSPEKQKGTGGAS